MSKTVKKRIKTIFDSDQVVTSYKGQKSLTKSEFKDECDINNIVRRSLVSGSLPSGSRQPMFDDFTQIQDYSFVQNQIAKASQAFYMLPSELREKFDNNVATLLDFLDNPDNLKEAQALGLLSGSTTEDVSSNVVNQTEKVEDNSVEIKQSEDS